MAQADAAIPLVDVSLDECAAAAKVYKACTDSGFFYGAHTQSALDLQFAGVAGATAWQALQLSVRMGHGWHQPPDSQCQLQTLTVHHAACAVTGHGIPEQLLVEVFRQFQAAFALPEGAHSQPLSFLHTLLRIGTAMAVLTALQKPGGVPQQCG